MDKGAYTLPNMGGGTISARLALRLMEELRAGAFAASARLPAELELAERYGVSRSVVRDALAELEREGVVERGRGVGTVVNRQILELKARLDLKVEYNDLIRACGALPGTDSVAACAGRADAALAERLEVDEGAPLVICEKRILASGRPVIWSVDYLPAELPGAGWEGLDWSRPVYDLLEERCGIAVDTNITRLAAVVGPAPVRRALKAQPGEALLLLEEVGTYKLTRPILYSCGFYTSYFEFTLLRKKL